MSELIATFSTPPKEVEIAKLVSLLKELSPGRREFENEKKEVIEGKFHDIELIFSELEKRGLAKGALGNVRQFFNDLYKIEEKRNRFLPPYPAAAVSDLSLMADLLCRYHARPRGVPVEMPVIRLFDGKALSTPAKVVITCQGTREQLSTRGEYSDDIKQYDQLKAGLEKYIKETGDKNIVFDTAELTITIYHNEREIESILETIRLRRLVGGPITISRMAATRAGGGKLSVPTELHDAYKVQENELLRQAGEFFKTHSQRTVEVDASVTSSNKIPLLLQNHSGICIGEVHNDPVPKAYIIEHLQEFRDNGVRTLFLEHLCYDTAQKWLDDYFRSPKDAPMPSALATYLATLDTGFRIPIGGANFTDLVKAAKAKGIRIVGMDTSVSYICGTTDQMGVENARARYAGMNYASVKIMENEKGNDKFIALMGSGHLGKTEGVPGVADLMSCPSVVVRGDRALQPGKESLQLNVKNYQKEVEHVGVVFSIGGYLLH